MVTITYFNKLKVMIQIILLKFYLKLCNIVFFSVSILNSFFIIGDIFNCLNKLCIIHRTSNGRCKPALTKLSTKIKTYIGQCNMNLYEPNKWLFSKYSEIWSKRGCVGIGINCTHKLIDTQNVTLIYRQ